MIRLGFLLKTPTPRILSTNTKKLPKLFSRDAIDEDKDGEISKEEFFSNALKSPFVHFILKEKDPERRRPKTRN